MRFVPASFRTRLLLGAALPALLMVSLLEWVFLNRYQADLEQSFQERGQAIARQLGPAAEFALFSGSAETLRVLAEATRQSDPQIMSVSVLDPAGKALQHAGAPPSATAPLTNSVQVRNTAELTSVVAPIWQTALPVESDDLTLAWGTAARRQPVLAGYVVVEISRAELAVRQREMVQITLAILLGGLLLASWLSFRISAGVMAQLDAANSELRRQKEAAEALARTDALTGLANRRAFDEAAQHEVQRAQRYGTPLTMVMTDIDHFKNVNDKYGHHVGDLVLKDFARVLLASVRGVDLVGRWGGEEFAILMPGTDLAEAQLAAERMRLAVAGAPLKFAGQSCGYTASFGVAEFLPETPTMDALLGRADAAMYRAKALGRNRVEVG